ncbi:DNA sulfur modification protein DndB [Micromonospora carbonacea]|uniref:DNA sulfur modification protein DndB n=1 Tax=Micromonospora carbonacea TaxID=47853 RepID=UPI0037187603
MPSKNFIPAFRAHVGNWQYYLCLMSYAQVAREISFAYEMGGNKDLATMIQRGIGNRTEQIRDYLLENEHRFLGSLVVAAWGGAPEYIALQMEESAEQNYLSGVDREFGVLTFDGTQQFFALDGQHRLKAIKDAIKQKPELGREDIGVIVVPHFDSSEGRQQTRRLFTNINRNAVKTSAQENIALDEDDGFAILTRRFLTEHPFLSRSGVVQVFTKQTDEGELRLATRQVPPTRSAWTTIGVLYDILKELGFDLDGSMHVLSQRATDEVLDESYERLSIRLEQLFEACGDVRKRYLAAAAPRDLRVPKGHEGDGHPFMRPVVQTAVARAIHQVVEQGLIDWKEALVRLSTLDWRMSAGPFNAVWQEGVGPGSKGKMVTGKDFSSLLFELLVVHLAPNSKAQIDRTLRSYRQLKNQRYFATTDELMANIVVTTLPRQLPPPPTTPATVAVPAGQPGRLDGDADAAEDDDE